MIRRSKYDLGNSWNYVRLALQSAHRDQDLAAKTVRECTVLDDDLTKETWTRISIRSMALALALLMETTEAEARCHHFSIWKNPWPQSCSGTGEARAGNLAPQSPARADRSWFVEVVNQPPDINALSDAIVEPKKTMSDEERNRDLEIIKHLPEDVQRQIGIEALKQMMPK